MVTWGAFCSPMQPASIKVGTKTTIAPEILSSGRPELAYRPAPRDVWSALVCALVVVALFATGDFPVDAKGCSTLNALLAAVSGKALGQYLAARVGDPTVVDFLVSGLVADPARRPTFAALLKHPLMRNIPGFGSREVLR